MGKTAENVQPLPDVPASADQSSGEARCTKSLVAVLQAYEAEKKTHRTSPSFYIAVSRRLNELASQEGNTPDESRLWKEAACRVVSNCLELNAQEVQLLRSVAYFLLYAGEIRYLFPIAMEIFSFCLSEIIAAPIPCTNGSTCANVLSRTESAARLRQECHSLDVFSSIVSRFVSGFPLTLNQCIKIFRQVCGGHLRSD